jgi:hypothetical protein
MIEDAPDGSVQIVHGLSSPIETLGAGSHGDALDPSEVLEPVDWLLILDACSFRGLGVASAWP